MKRWPLQLLCTILSLVYVIASSSEEHPAAVPIESWCGIRT